MLAGDSRMAMHVGHQTFRRLPPLQQHNVTQMNVLYGEWLRDQCEVTSLPCLESQPWATLANRCARALH